MAAAKTLQEQLAAAKQRVADIEAKIAAEANAPRPELGADVGFLYGRGDNRKTYNGRIVAVSEDGKRVRVQFGEGFDTDVVTVTTGELVPVNKEVATGAASVAGTGVATTPAAVAQQAAVNEAADPVVATPAAVADAASDGIPL